MEISHITSLLGGIALFLYGMSIMGAGLEKLAGGPMQSILQRLTSSTIKGVIFGTLITAVIQSSAGTVVICVGLVNSGIMTLSQSVGVIMGANIGTTVTGQLIRMADISGDSLLLTLMQPKTFAPVVAFVGCIFYVFLRGAKRKNLGQIMLGFGILFTGMSLMDAGVAPLKESPAIQSLFVSMKNPLLGVLVGSGGYGADPVLLGLGGYFAGAVQHRTGHLRLCDPHYPGRTHRYRIYAAAYHRRLLQGWQAGCLYPSVFQCGGQCDDAGADLCSAGAVWGAALGRCDDQKLDRQYPHPVQCGGYAFAAAVQRSAAAAEPAHRSLY